MDWWEGVEVMTGNVGGNQSGMRTMVRSLPVTLPQVDPEFVPADIPGIRKAAILMMALGDDLAKVMFREMGQKQLERVTHEIMRLGDVPAALLEQVLTEFFGLLETKQYTVRGGSSYALRLLTEAFGDKRAQELLGQVRDREEAGAADLAMLQEMDPQQLSRFLENEHPQTVALVLAHLEPQQGSALLMALKPELRVDAVQRLAEIRQFSPEMAQKVALVLARRIDSLGSSGRRSYEGFRSVADLLNRLDAGVSKDILENIERNEPKLAIGIRDLMFTFDDLLTVPQQGVREIVSAVDKRTLATALKGARENLKAHLFKAMSSRAMEMLRDDMESMGRVRGKDVVKAQQDMLAVARSLEAQGRIVLRLEAESELAV
jgi:flagellar motor switch protein FliG